MRAVVVVVILLGCGRVHFAEHVDPDATGSDAGVDDDAQQPDAGPCTAINCTGTDVSMSCNGRCFASCRESITQAAAEAQCQAWGGELASIRNQAEQDCMTQIAVQQGASWIGYRQTGVAVTPIGGWGWTDGSPTTFVGWGASEPDDIDMTENGEEDCAQIFETGEWIDWDCPGTVPAFSCVR